MADNTTLNSGSGGDVFATDDIGGVKYPRSKIVIGADGVNDGDVSSANPLPCTSVITGNALTALQLIDNIVHVDDAAFTLGTSSGTVVMGFAGTQSVDANDACALACTTAGALHISDASGSLTVDNGGTFVVQVDGAALTALQLIDNLVLAEDAAHVSGDVGVQGLTVRQDTAAALGQTDGDYQPLVTDSTGRLWCNVSNTVTVASHAVTNAGTFVVQENGAALTALQIMDDWDNGASDGASVSGDVAHDTADAGEPVKLGAKAESALSGITLVADGDRTNLYAGLDGVLIVRPHTNLEDVVSERTTNTDGASTAFASGLAAPGAGIYLRITSVTVCNSSASFCTVDLRDGSAGSVLWTLPVPATGGVVQTFDPPLKLSANTALAFDASAAISTITISANGFKSKV